MKKIIAVIGLLLLVGCSKQNQIQPAEPPYVKQSYSESDPAAKLSVVQFAGVVKSIYPEYQITYSKDVGEVKFLPSDVKPDAEFVRANNWYSIKVIRDSKTENWETLIVEVLNQNSYAESKAVAFHDCQKIFGNIDNRILTVIDELENRVEQNEKTGSSAFSSANRYGYTVNLDASHYNEGYPVSCIVNSN
ncbi:hypothetical protein [Acinetobacter baumannii]|nr:hypothetical protein [Acinetobacter baumannii]ADX03006.1 Hypothetical protein ABK1_1372 [Acinetobacter baumannii 1656-2]AOP63352.1 hypothetical protein DU202_02189 [Acinetobacter baumannii DU202]RQL52003.1 hypothetical protein BJI61_00190 [Acinetobacter baumannii]RSP41884.1 hypothetical protein EA733_06315 [Acinetobacter baumannii]